MAALEICVVGAALGGSVAWMVQWSDPWEQEIQGEEQEEQRGLKALYFHSAFLLSLR